MANKQIKEKRDKKRLASLEKAGRIIQGYEIPKNSLPGDPTKQAHKGGYSPKLYYQNIHYTCEACKKESIWSAEQQKKYFEMQKGNIYNKPKWCYDCHLIHMQQKNATDT